MRRPFLPPKSVKSLDSLKPVTMCLMKYEPEFNRGTIGFQGYKWEVKAASRMGPGPNKWSAEGTMFMSIRMVICTWRLQNTKVSGPCREVVATEPLGYGEYRWVASDELIRKSSHTVLGLFFLCDDRIEIDFECTSGGDHGEPRAPFVIQPNVKEQLEPGMQQP